MKRFIPFVIIVVICAASPVLAQTPGDPDAEGCKDSSLMTRMPGCTIIECETKEFDAAELWNGSYSDEGSHMKRLEGQVEKLRYLCPARLSLLQISRNAEAALKKAGYAITFSGKGEDEEPVVTGRKGAQWISIQANSYNELTSYRQSAVLVEEMKQTLEADAAAMAAEIEKTGSVAVYGINFDTGKATITPDSAKVLQEVRSLMQQQGDWRFEVQGHTDSVGSKAANQALSEQRAAAVAAWLVKNGISQARLTSKGYGDAAPVADNTTEEGRAKNRRVELKKID